ncbi:hypothetical protein F4777DRAFT_576676 [Nemania sp. FL0916]|nr:hypothetical protein F4777DRAFT_576676 [Nemania sp. FL0916]
MSSYIQNTQTPASGGMSQNTGPITVLHAPKLGADEDRRKHGLNGRAGAGLQNLAPAPISEPRPAGPQPLFPCFFEGCQFGAGCGFILRAQLDEHLRYAHQVGPTPPVPIQPQAGAGLQWDGNAQQAGDFWNAGLPGDIMFAANQSSPFGQIVPNVISPAMTQDMLPVQVDIPQAPMPFDQLMVTNFPDASAFDMAFENNSNYEQDGGFE